MVILFILDAFNATSPAAALRRPACYGLVTPQESAAQLGTSGSQWHILREPAPDDDDDSVDSEPASGKATNAFYQVIAVAVAQCAVQRKHLLITLNSASHGTAAARRRLTTSVRSRYVQLSSRVSNTSDVADGHLFVLHHILWPHAALEHFDVWWRPWLDMRDALTLASAPSCTLEEAALSLLTSLEAATPCEPIRADEGWDLVEHVLSDPCEVLKDAYARVCLAASTLAVPPASSPLIVLDLCSLVDSDGNSSLSARTRSDPDAVFLSTLAAVLEAATVVVLVPDVPATPGDCSVSVHTLVQHVLRTVQSAGVPHYVARLAAAHQEPRADSVSSPPADSRDPISAFAALTRSPSYQPWLASALIHGLTVVLQESPPLHKDDEHCAPLSWLSGQWTWLVDPSSCFAERCGSVGAAPLLTVKSWHQPNASPSWHSPAPALPGTRVRVCASVLLQWYESAATVPTDWRHADGGSSDSDENVRRAVCGPVEIHYTHVGRPDRGAHDDSRCPTQTPFLLLGACLRCTSTETVESGQQWLASSEAASYVPHYQTCGGREGPVVPLMRVVLLHQPSQKHVAAVRLCAGAVTSTSCHLCQSNLSLWPFATPPCVHVAALLHISMQCFFTCPSAAPTATEPVATRRCETAEPLGGEPPIAARRGGGGLPAFMLRGTKPKRAPARPRLPKRERTAGAETPEAASTPTQAVDVRRPMRDVERSHARRRPAHDEEPALAEEAVPPALNEGWRMTSQNVWQCDWDAASLPVYEHSFEEHDDTPDDRESRNQQRQ